MDTRVFLLNCLKFKRCFKTRIVLRIFESDNVTLGDGKLEKVMENFMESHGIYRAQKGTNPVSAPDLFCH